MKRFCLIAALVWLTPCLPSHAQTTNRALSIRAAATRVAVPPPVLTRPAATVGGSGSAVEIKLPKNLSRYHVLEQRAQTTRPATNLTATSANQVRTALTPGSTLLFMEKEAPASVKASARPAPRPLFSTILLMKGS